MIFGHMPKAHRAQRGSLSAWAINSGSGTSLQVLSSHVAQVLAAVRLISSLSLVSRR
jgi:hypothetical protein